MAVKRKAPIKIVDAGDVDLDREVIFHNGERLTEAGAEKLGRQLADATHATRSAGRPSLAKGKSPHVSFRVSAATKKRLEGIAEAEGKSSSAVAREVLEKYLASH